MKEKSVSGIRESNPPFKLGKLAHYRCANTAIQKRFYCVSVFFSRLMRLCLKLQFFQFLSEKRYCQSKRKDLGHHI